MELAGNEKKIQALFRELKLEDERLRPGFAGVWIRVQAESPRPLPAFKLSFALAVLLVITLFSLALWSRSWQQTPSPKQEIAAGSTNGSTNSGTVPTSTSASPEPKQIASDKPRHRVQANLAARKSAARRRANELARQAVIREALALSTWQSPTATLMQSPADDVLTSLPQLTQTVQELKTFLPNTPK